jgi:lysophospholipase L1-like esterase
LNVRTSLIFALAVVATASPALAEKALPLHIGGRVAPAEDGKGYIHQWPGTYFEGRFRGTAAAVRVQDNANILDIFIDGQLVRTITKPGDGQVEFANLSDQEHSIRVEKRTEAAWTSAQFVGVFVPDSAEVLSVKPRARQIEFIGDSYTVGYGNTSPKRECPGDGVWAMTQTQLAFGPLTAKHFNADYRVNAISGRGIVRNYNGGAGLHLPEAYPNIINLDNGTVLETDTKTDDWAPQVMVIGLGTNDFSTPLNPGEKWKSRDELQKDYVTNYIAFVQRLRADNPGAYFVLMATDQANGEIQGQVAKVLAGLKAAGETRVAFLGMNGLSFEGCDWHPSAADDRKVSDSLIAFLNSQTDIWQNR